MTVTFDDIAGALAFRSTLALLPRDRVLDAVDRMAQPVRHFLGVVLSSIAAHEQGWGTSPHFGMEN
jgi:hypothetical protein